MINRKNRSTSSATKSRREEWPACQTQRKPVTLGTGTTKRRRGLSGIQMGSSCGPSWGSLEQAKRAFREDGWPHGLQSQDTLTLLQRSRG